MSVLLVLKVSRVMLAFKARKALRVMLAFKVLLVLKVSRVTLVMPGLKAFRALKAIQA
jgi:hypothetical protein